MLYIWATFVCLFTTKQVAFFSQLVPLPTVDQKQDTFFLNY